VDGCHPNLQPMPCTLENLSWCCGDGLDFTFASGFLFLPGKKLRQKNMNQNEMI